MALEQDSRSLLITKLYTTQYFYCNSESANYSKEVFLPYFNHVEKFDDIKFGKVLTKLYSRMFTME